MSHRLIRRTIVVQKGLMAYHEAVQRTIFDTNGGIIAARTHADSRKGLIARSEAKANLIRIKIACVFTTK